MSDQYVYFIQADENGPIKIGFTSDDPKRRLNQLQTGNASALRLLGAIKGTSAQEKQFHADLSQWRLQGEWFESHPTVLATIEAALSSSSEQGECRRDVGDLCNLHCSFCLRCSHEVAALIKGPTGNICDTCVDLCAEIVAAQKQQKISCEGKSASQFSAESL